jgi:tungstate transport system substrate-binding protein
MANDERDGVDGERRSFLHLTGGSALLGAIPALLSGCARPAVKPEETSPPAATTPAPPGAPVNAKLVRVLSVPTAVEGALLPALVADFQKQSGLTVELSATDDVYGRARAGESDLAISHYGHRHAEEFVMDGFGEWPRTLFSNQMALLGPKDDPAKVRGLEDAAEGFKRIARARSPFVMNDIDGVRYLTEILWNAAGRPERGEWFIDDRKHRKEDAIHFAASKRAYVFWGLTPFLRAGEHADLGLEPLLLADPLLQRMLVSIVVKPAKVPGVNIDGAKALEAYLLSPATQAHIREVRYPGATRCTWIPGGRHNRTAILPKT